VDGLKETDIVDCTGDVGEELADPGSAFAVLAKRPWRSQQLSGARELDGRLLNGKRLAISALQLWLIVERVHVGRSTVHEEEDDSLGFGGKVES
jgi:hypothetical protein